MTFDEGISLLIGDIYASPVDDDAWNRVLAQLLARTGSQFILVSAVDLKSKAYSRASWHGLDKGRFLDGMIEYGQEQFRHDPLLNWAARNPRAGFAESRQALRSLGRSLDDPFYDKFCAGQLGTGHNAVCYTAPNDDLTLGVSINLPSNRSQYRPEELQLFRLLFDHLQRATLLAARPPDLLGERDATLLLDERGIILNMSAAAEAIFAHSDGLRVVGQRLLGDRPEDTRRIDALIARTLAVDTPGGGGGALMVERRSGKAAWILIADCLPNRATFLSKFTGSAVIRIIERPLRISPDAVTRLADLFNLSPTESRILGAVFTQNLDLREAADQLGLTYATARVHMRRVLSKTDVRSQTALARLVQKIGG